MQRPLVRGIAWWHPSLLLFLALSVLDAVSTWIAMQSGLPEGNYLPAMLLRAGGPSAMYAFKVAAVLLVASLVLALTPHFPRLWRALHFANWFMLLVLLINVVQIAMA